MGLTTKKYGNASVSPIKVTNAIKKGLYAYYKGDHQPSLSAPNGYGDPTGGNGDTNRMVCAGSTFPLRSQYHVKVGQVLLGPLLDVTNGLEVTQDQTNTRGIEHLFGALGAAGAFTATVGTDNVFLRMKFKITTVAGTASCYVGFRKTQAFQAAVASYTDSAALNVDAGTVKCKTNLANAGVISTTTAKAWADGEVHELLVKVTGTRVTFWFDGAPIAGLPEFNFAAATVIAPFFFFLQNGTTTTVFWQEVETGHLADINANGDPT